MDLLTDPEFLLFEEMPVDIRTFTEDYLGLKGQIWDGLMDLLVEVAHGDYWLVCLDGAIGWGKSTFAKILTLYTFYMTTILRNPQQAFGFASGTQLSILGVGKTKEQSKNVFLNDTRSYMRLSPYFSPRLKKRDIVAIKQEIRAPHKGVYILIAGSLAEENVLGLNLVSAVMEEVNFWGVLANSTKYGRDYNVAMNVFDMLLRRFQSRYMNMSREDFPFTPKMVIASSNYTPSDLTEQIRYEFEGERGVFFARLRNWDTRPIKIEKTFRVCVGSQYQLPRIIESAKDCSECKIAPNQNYKTCGHRIEEVPEEYRLQFERDILGSMRDFLGIPYSSVEPFIVNREAVFKCIDPSLKHHYSYDKDGIELIRSFQTKQWEIPLPNAPNFKNKHKPRYMHVDLGVRHDACGIAMCYHNGFKAVERVDEKGFKRREFIPEIVVDFMLRVKPPHNGEIPIAEVRKLIYWIRDQGIRIAQVTFDQFQSIDSMQILQSKGINTDYLSVDRSPDPYYTLRNALYEGTVRIYNYKPFIDELLALEEDLGRGIIDHPPDGSKDVADAVAGCVFNCFMNAKRHEPVEVIPGQDRGEEEGEWWKDLMLE